MTSQGMNCGHIVSIGPLHARKNRRGTYDPRVPLGSDPTIFRPKGVHNPPQTEIYSRRHKGRPNSQTYNLYQKPVLLPLIFPTQDPSDIADDLACHTQ